jgi:hypothetical protein
MARVLRLLKTFRNGLPRRRHSLAKETLARERGLVLMRMMSFRGSADPAERSLKLPAPQQCDSKCNPGEAFHRIILAVGR